MLKNISLISIILIALCQHSFAENIVEGVAVDSYDWERVCSQMPSIPLETPTISCPVSHPLSNYHRHRVMALAEKMYPGQITCEYLEREYDFFKEPIPMPDKESGEWATCKALFISILKQRVLTPDDFSRGEDSWMDLFLN